MLRGECLCGATAWEMDGDPGPVTACNCSACHRYGALWAYDYLDERIRIRGPVSELTRVGKENPALAFVFCGKCSCVVAWRATKVVDGRRRAAVNVRLAPFEAVAHLPIDHFDGRDTFDDLPRDGRTVRDMWF